LCSDEELRAYYEQPKQTTASRAQKRKFRYIFIDRKRPALNFRFRQGVCESRYGQAFTRTQEAGVKVQQIVLKVARKDLDAQVEQKAKDLIAKLGGNNQQSTEAAFAEAARGNSEDPATAKKRGFLGRLVKKNPNKPDALYDRAIDMEPGAISDIPIRYGGNWYILRRGDAVPKTFEEAKQEILVSLRNRRATEQHSNWPDGRKAV